MNLINIFCFIFITLNQINSQISYPKCPCPNQYHCFKTKNYVRCSNEICSSSCYPYPNINNINWCDCTIIPAPTPTPTPIIEHKIIGTVNDSATLIFIYDGSFTIIPTQQLTLPLSISSDNIIIGFSGFNNNTSRSFIYDGTFSFIDGYLLTGMSSDGSVIIGSNISNFGTSKNDIFEFDNDIFKLDNDIFNLDSYAPNAPYVSYKYVGGVFIKLGSLCGLCFSNALGISKYGDYIVGWSDVNNNDFVHSVIYYDNTIKSLGTLCSKYNIPDIDDNCFSYALGISSNGNVIVGASSNVSFGELHATIFNRHNSSLNINLGLHCWNNDLICKSSIASGVSDDGNTIFGISYDTNDIEYMFIYKNSAIIPIILNDCYLPDCYYYRFIGVSYLFNLRSLSSDGEIIVGNIYNNSKHIMFIYTIATNTTQYLNPE